MSKKQRRVDIKKILRDPGLCRELMIDTIVATQAREGITTTREQAAEAWDKVQLEKMHYSPKQLATVSPQRPLRAPRSYREFATVFAEDTLLQYPRMRKILRRLGTRGDKRVIVKLLVEAWLNGWIHANAERDDDIAMRSGFGVWR